MEDFDGLTPPSQIVFDTVSLWIRMFYLPLACMNQKVGSQIGASVGVVEEVEMDEEGIGWGEFLQV